MLKRKASLVIRNQNPALMRGSVFGYLRYDLAYPKGGGVSVIVGVGVTVGVLVYGGGVNVFVGIGVAVQSGVAVCVGGGAAQ